MVWMIIGPFIGDLETFRVILVIHSCFSILVEHRFYNSNKHSASDMPDGLLGVRYYPVNS